MPQTVDVPKLPPKLDFVLLMDTSGSMQGEVQNAQNGGSSVFRPAVVSETPDARLAVASFEDYPYSTYGTPAEGDLPYRLLTDLTSDATAWQTALNQLTLRFGSDLPEAQVPALFASVTGASLAWPGGSTPMGGISFRPGAAHFVALVSDAPFHNDKTGQDPYAGFTAPTYAEALNALSLAKVRVIAADSNGAAVGADMAAIAADTGGASFPLPSDGTGLWAGTGSPGSPGILGALRAATYPVTTQTSCDPLEVTLSQASWADVAGDTQLSHSQTITVPAGLTPAQLPADRKVVCEVAYTWGEVALGSNQAEIEVVFPDPQLPGPGADIPSNVFSIGRVKSTSKGTATLPLTFPGPGTLDLVATATRRPRPSARIRVARVRKAITAAGTVRIALKPSRKAKRILKSKRRLKTRVRLTYTPTGGAARSLDKTVTLRLPRSRR